MKLKLSTLAVIIGVIFLAYYYFIYAPCAAQSAPSTPGSEQPIIYAPTEEDPYAGGVTLLDSPSLAVTPLYEGFEAPGDEPVESRQVIQRTYNSTSIDDLAGNVRPDNVMQVNEPVTELI